MFTSCLCFLVYFTVMWTMSAMHSHHNKLSCLDIPSYHSGLKLSEPMGLSKHFFLRAVSVRYWVSDSGAATTSKSSVLVCGQAPRLLSGLEASCCLHDALSESPHSSAAQHCVFVVVYFIQQPCTYRKTPVCLSVCLSP